VLVKLTPGKHEFLALWTNEFIQIRSSYLEHNDRDNLPLRRQNMTMIFAKIFFLLPELNHCFGWKQVIVNLNSQEPLSGTFWYFSVNRKHSQTLVNKQIQITTTCLQRPHFWGPIFNFYNIKFTRDSDHLFDYVYFYSQLGIRKSELPSPTLRYVQISPKAKTYSLFFQKIVFRRNFELYRIIGLTISACGGCQAEFNFKIQNQFPISVDYNHVMFVAFVGPNSKVKSFKVK